MAPTYSIVYHQAGVRAALQGKGINAHLGEFNLTRRLRDQAVRATARLAMEKVHQAVISALPGRTRALGSIARAQIMLRLAQGTPDLHLCTQKQAGGP